MRNPTFDIMKGIAIIAVIVGHCPMPELCTNLLYAWHIPIFFFISGYFYKHRSNHECLTRSAKSLLLPYIATALITLIIASIETLIGFESNLKVLLFGVIIGASGFGLPMFADYIAGATWFLLALFWCRLVYNNISEFSCKIRWTIVIALFFLSVIAAKFIYIPTQVLSGINGMLFFAIGHELKLRKLSDKHKNISYVVSVLFLILSAYNGALNVSGCYYPCLIVNIAGALSGIYIVYSIARYFSKFKRLSSILCLIGEISILILAVHRLDGFLVLAGRICSVSHFSGYVWLFALICARIAVAVLISIAIYRNKYVRVIYFNNR